MTTNPEALALATAAFAKVIGRHATVPEMRLLLAKGKKESGYGGGWTKPAGYSGQWPPNNIGGVQATSDWHGQTFTYGDTHATGKPYTAQYKVYPTPAEGWQDFVRELFVNPSRGRSAVLAAASADDPYAFSYQVVATGYSESSGLTLQARVDHHYAWLAPAIAELDKAFGWPAPAHDSGLRSPRPFPPPAYPPSPPPPPPDSPAPDPVAALMRAMADNTIALGTLHADITALRTDLAQFRADLLARFPRAAE